MDRVEIELAGRLSDDQLRSVRAAVTGMLASRADDLRLLHTREDPDREVSEVVALARLAFWLERGEIQVPDDRVVEEVAASLAAGVKHMNDFEEIREQYEEAVAEEEALGAPAKIFSDDPPGGSSKPSSEASP